MIHTFGFTTLVFNIDIVVFLNVCSSLTIKNEITLRWKYVYEHYGTYILLQTPWKDLEPPIQQTSNIYDLGITWFKWNNYDFVIGLHMLG